MLLTIYEAVETMNAVFYKFLHNVTYLKHLIYRTLAPVETRLLFRQTSRCEVFCFPLQCFIFTCLGAFSKLIFLKEDIDLALALAPSEVKCVYL